MDDTLFGLSKSAYPSSPVMSEILASLKRICGSLRMTYLASTTSLYSVPASVTAFTVAVSAMAMGSV